MVMNFPDQACYFFFFFFFFFLLRSSAVHGPGRAHTWGRRSMSCWIVFRSQAGCSGSASWGQYRRPKGCAKRETPNSGGWEVRAATPRCQKLKPNPADWALVGLRPGLPADQALPYDLGAFSGTVLNAHLEQQRLARAIPAVHPCGSGTGRS